MTTTTQNDVAQLISTMTEEVINSFNRGVRDFVKMTIKEFPEHTDHIKQEYGKFLLAVRLDPAFPATQFGQFMDKHRALVESRSDAFFTEIVPTIPFLGDLKLDIIWTRATNEQKANIWKSARSLLHRADAVARAGTVDETMANEMLSFATTLDKQIRSGGTMDAKQVIRQWNSSPGLAKAHIQPDQASEVEKLLSTIPQMAAHLADEVKKAQDRGEGISLEQATEMLRPKNLNSEA